MFKRGRVYLSLTIFSLCLVMAWHFGLFEKFVRQISIFDKSDLQTLQMISKLPNNSISEKNNLVNSSVADQPLKVKPVRANKTQSKAEVERPLPVLTAEPQDSFYGKGCKVNRYRGRLQKILNEWQKIVKRRNITEYFICYGSFLGFVRNGDIVPYDSDMDVCMFRHDYHKLYPEEAKRPVDLNDGKFHMLLQRHSPHPKWNTPSKNCKGEMVRRVVDDCSILDPHGRLYLGRLIYLDIFMIEDYGPQFWDEYSEEMDTKHGWGTATICVRIDSLARFINYIQLNNRCVVGYSDDNTIREIWFLI